MKRLALLAALGLAACDSIDPLELTSPYDPLAGSAGVEVTGPVDLRLASSTSTSFRLEWTDRSGGLARYDVWESYSSGVPHRDVRDSLVARLRVGATSHALAGLSVYGDRTFYVVGTFPDSVRTRPTDTIRVRYPSEDTESQNRLAYASGVVFSLDGRVVFAGGGNAFALTDGQLHERDFVRANNRHLTVLPTGRTLVIGLPQWGYSFQTWDLTDGRVREGIEMEGADTSCGQFQTTLDGRRAAALCDGYEAGRWEARYWDLLSGREVGRRLPLDQTLSGSLIALSPDAALLFVRGNDGRVRALNAGTGSLIWQSAPFQAETVAAVVDGGRIILADGRAPWQTPNANAIRVYDLATGALLAERKGQLNGDLLRVYEGLVVYRARLPEHQGGVVRIADASTLETVRDVSVPDHSGVAGAYLSGDRMIILEDWRIRRLDFTRSWEAVPPDA